MTGPGTGPATGDEQKRVALLVASVASFLAPFMISAVNVALPAIGAEFGAGAVFQSWVTTSYLLSATIFLIPFGRIADIHGRKRIFVYGMLVTVASSILSALAGTEVLFIGSRVLQGVGGAMILGTGVAILTSVFPLQERGRALGINVASVYLGLSLGPSVGGFMTERLGWRSIFVFSAMLGAAIIALTLWKLRREWAGARGEGFDLPGTLIYGVMLVSLMYGFSIMPSAAGFTLMALGIASLVLFLLREGRAADPILDVRLIRGNTVFALSNLAALINYSATFATTFLLNLYLQSGKDLSPEDAGLVLIAQPVVMTVFSPAAGRLSDRVEPRIVATAGMSCTTIGLLMLVFLGPDTGIPYIVASLAVLGSGFAMFSSPNTNAIMSSVDMRHYGVASGTVGTMRMIGQMLSMGVAMLLLSVFIGNEQISPDNIDRFLRSLEVSFVFFTCLCFAGIFASLARGRLR